LIFSCLVRPATVAGGASRPDVALAAALELLVPPKDDVVLDDADGVLVFDALFEVGVDSADVLDDAVGHAVSGPYSTIK
jgi:hypothetical protein